MKLTKVSPRQVIIALSIAIVLYYLVSTCTTSKKKHMHQLVMVT